MGTRIGRARRPNDDMRLAFSYARFSTDMQGSIAEQDAINDEVAADHDISILRRFADEGMSRSIMGRPDLQAMIAAFKERPEVRYLVVNELERLTAGAAQRVQIASLCKTYGITIVTEDVGLIDPHDEQRMIEADERAIKSKAEVVKVRRRTRRNLRQKVIAGTIARRPAYGVRMKPIVGPDGQELPSGMALIDGRGRKVRSGELEEHPDELPWLRKIFEWAGEGLSDDRIAARLTTEGVPTKTGGATWRGNTIRGILSNPLYKGQLVWGLHEMREDAEGKRYLEMREEGDSGIVILPSPLGALVDPVLWERLAAEREDRIGQRRSVRRTYEARPFDTIVYCRRCQRRMYGRNDVNSQIYLARKRGEDLSRFDGKVIWRYYCNSKRSGLVGREGDLPPCDKARTMPEKKILMALDYAAALGKHATGDVDVLDVPCRTCNAAAGSACVTKSGNLFVGREGLTHHSARMEVVETLLGRDDTAPQGRFRFVEAEPRDISVERRLIRAEISRLEALLETQQELAMEGLVSKEKLRKKKDETDQKIALEQAKLDALAVPREVSQQITGSYAVSLGALADLLASDLLSPDQKVAAIHRVGIRRIFVDDPVVEVELAW